jgi:hypothetical protein
MAHDSDVARVAAALKSPGIRYRNFGIDPVRAAVTQLGNAVRSVPLLGVVRDEEAGTATSREDPAVLPETHPAAEAASHAVPGMLGMAAPEPVPAMPEAVGTRPAPPAAAAADTPAGHSPFGAATACPEPSFGPAPAAFPEFAAPGYGLAPAGRKAGSYRLLEALGMPGEPPHAPSPAGPPPATMPEPPPRGTTGTMQSLGRAVAGAQLPAAQPVAEPPAAAMEVAGLPTFPGLLPAAMVTLPLAEVLRLIATGVSAASSPFAALRVSGGAINSR